MNSQIKPAEYAGNLLDRLISLDEQVTGAYFEMGQLLSAIEHGKLWELLGYESFRHVVEEELSFSPNTAAKYLHTYRHFKRLGYTKTESLAMISEFSFTRVSEYVVQAKAKAGIRSIRNAIQRNIENHRQINFTVNKDDYDLICQVLSDHGAFQRDSGRWEGTTDALIDVFREFYPSTKRAA